jgi:hypothetical protein
MQEIKLNMGANLLNLGQLPDRRKCLETTETTETSDTKYFSE